MSGMWDVTTERVDLIRSSLGRLSKSNQRVANEMLNVAADQNLWTCKAEYYTVLVAIQQLNMSVTREEVLDTIKTISESAERDRVGHREWVTSAVDLLRRISDGM
ncbi:MAG: hypothetical protein ACYTFU_11005 [Planctomycetota bacterium]